MLVDKAFRKELLTSRKGLKELYRLYPEEIRRGFAVGVPVTAAMTGAELGRHRNNPRGPTASAAIGGAVTGQIGYHAAGFAAQRKGRHQSEAGKQMHNGLNSHAQRDIWFDHLRSNGVTPGTQMSAVPYHTREKIFRTFPESLPGAGAKRLTARYTLGSKRGLAASGVMTGLGALGAAEAAHYGSNKRRSRREDLEKSDRSNGVRILEAGTGAGLLAWGVGRSPMVGRALARGLRQASGKESQAAVDALQIAQSAYGALSRGSLRGERAVRQVKAVNTAVDKVPSAIRPAVATTAGMLLLGHAQSVRRESAHPINIRIRTGVNR